MRRFLSALVTIFCLATLAMAQSVTSEILGIVKDPTGSAVPGAKVSVKKIDTNISRDTVTDNEGRFRALLLQPGAYQVIVEAAGFAKVIQGPVTLLLNERPSLDITLKVSSISETIEITSSAPLVNVTNAEVGVNFESKRITEMPLAANGNILGIALQVAGVSQLSSGNSTFAAGGVSFSVNGMRTRSNNFMIDGMDSNNPSVTGLVQEVNNPDAVAEFRLITNQFLPEYGRAAGSVVSLVTKNGTNAFHGTGYWAYNGNALNSRSNLDKRTFTKAPWRVQNQVGATIGGPIVKDKTFFFFSGLRWTDHRFASGTAITGAPTQAGKDIIKAAAGTLPQVNAVLTFLPAAQQATAATARFIRNGQTYLVPLGTLSGAAPNTFDAWQWTGRGDHRFNDKHSLMLRWASDTRTSVAGQGVPPGLTASTPAKRNSASAGLTSSLKSNLINEMRFGFQRISSVTSAADANAATIPSIEIPEFGLNGFNDATTRTAIGLALNLPQSQILTNYQLVNNMTYIKGSHNMKFGIDFRRQDQAQEFNPTLRGRLVFNNLQDLVDDVAQTASINSFLPGVPKVQSYRYHDFFFYAQDEFRIKPNLTLTYGLRYESPGNPVNFLKGVNDKVVANNNNDERFRFTPVPPRDTNNWAPRVGFNWRPGPASGPLRFLAGDGKLAVRGGYSRTYDIIFNNIYLNIFSAFPFTVVNNFPARSPGAFPLITGIAFGGVRPVIANPSLVTRTQVDKNFRAPVAEQFSFNIQRQLVSNWALTTGWVATKGTGLFQSVDGNPTIQGANGNGTIRVDPTKGIIRLRSNAASSIYHSLQTSLERRFSGNLAFAAHYTWSAFIDNASEVFNPSVAGEVAVSQDSFNRSLDRGRSTYDRPHRFSANALYELPWFRDQKGGFGRILGGWQAGGLLTFQAGPPFSPLAGSDPGFRLSGIDSLVGNAIRPNVETSLALGSMSLPAIMAAGGRNLFLDPAGRLTVTAARPIGNAGRNILRADGINNLDLVVTKNIRMPFEGHKLQFRAEFFNLTNTRDYGIPNATVTNAGFGLEGNTDGGNRRIIMMIRYTF